MSWFKKIARLNYLDIGHYGEKIYIWMHDGKKVSAVLSDPIEKNHYELYGFNPIAWGRIEPSKKVGSFSFQYELYYDDKLMEKIIPDVVVEFPDINFFVFPPRGPQGISLKDFVAEHRKDVLV